MRNSQSMAEGLKAPSGSSRRYESTALNKSRDSSLSHTRPNEYFQIRDELSKNPKRKLTKVDAYWLDEKDYNEKKDKEWWDNGNWDVVKEGKFWENGKYIPEDIGDRVKELISKELKMMKGKMQRDQVGLLEQMMVFKD